MNMLLYIISDAISVYCCYKILERLLVISESKRRQRVLILGCFILIGQIIFIADLANLPPAIILFAGAVHYGCEGSSYKRITLSLMLACSSLALNTIRDTYLMNEILSYGLYSMFWLIFMWWIKRIAPEENHFDLSSQL